MSVKIEEIKNTKLSAKGILRGVDDDGFHIEDEKTGEIETLSLDDFRSLIDKPISIACVNKEELD